MESEESVGVLGRAKGWYMEQYASNKLFVIFVTGMALFYLVNIISALLTDGFAFAYMVHPVQDYVFMDHFGSVIFSSDHPYTVYNVIYPPLITTIYAIIGHYTIPYMEGYDVGWDMAEAMRSTSMPMMVFLTLVLALVMSFYIVYQKYTENDFSRQEFNILFICLLFSYPVLFGLSTGNCIFLALLCSVLYIYCYDSDKRSVRIFSYIMLGVAAGVKIVPAILAVLTLKRRSWKEFAICVAIVCVLLLVPFVFTDGNPVDFILHALYYSSTADSAFGILNISDITNLLGLNGTISAAIKILVLCLIFGCILMDDGMERWEEATLLGAAMMLTFSVSVPYTLIYVVIGLIMLLSIKKEASRLILVSMVCFILIFADISAFTETPTYIGTIKGIALIIMTFILLGTSLLRMIRSGSTTHKDVAETSRK